MTSERNKHASHKEKLALQQPVDPFPNPVIAPTDAAGNNVAGGRFGCSRDNGTKMHYGTDLEAAVGTEFVSIYTGTVQDTRTDVSNDQPTPGSLGNYVIIKSTGLGVSIKYCHLSEVAVNNGDSVNQGDKLGKTGRSGNAFNAPHKHVHIEVSTDYFLTNQNRVDPEPYLKTKYGPNPNPTTCS